MTWLVRLTSAATLLLLPTTALAEPRERFGAVPPVGTEVAVAAFGQEPQVAGDSAVSDTQHPIVADTALEALTTSVASRLRCPVCQGLSIQDSPSPLALEMRDLIKDQLRSGRSPADVQDYFVAKYGEWILLEPEPSGFNLVVYLVPVLAVLGGLAIVWRSVRRWTAAGQGTET